MDVIAAYESVGTYRGAAEMCGTTHKTVRRMVEAHQAELAGASRVARKERGHNYDPVAELVGQRVKETSGRISAKRLLPAARVAGYAGSGRNFRRLVAEAKTAWRRDHHRGRRPGVWSPGETLIIDWGMLAGVHVFCAVLAWSRVRFIRFADNERQTTTLELLAECFEVLGGVPAVVLTDRMGCLKAGVVANLVVPTPDLVRFATHYGFRPDFCEAADPESKGMVENLVGYAKADLMVPQLPFTDLWTANDAAEAWCAEVNAVTHSEICAVPVERLAKEREVLRPLPSLRPEIGIKVITRKVDKLSCIRFGSARYSVPCRLIGAQVTVTASAAVLTVIEPVTGEVLAEHRLVGPGEVSIDDTHYDRPRPDKPRRGPRPRTQAEKDFCGLGPVADAFLVGATAAGVSRLGGELVDILALGAAHGQPALVAALGRAVTYRRWRAADIRSILATAGAAPTPRPAGQPLADVLTLPVVPTRSLDAYKITPQATEQATTAGPTGPATTGPAEVQ
jgi:transposase